VPDSEIASVMKEIFTKNAREWCARVCDCLHTPDVQECNKSNKKR
jgi:hypothetical protein